MYPRHSLQGDEMMQEAQIVSPKTMALCVKVVGASASWMRGPASPRAQP